MFTTPRTDVDLDWRKILGATITWPFWDLHEHVDVLSCVDLPFGASLLDSCVQNEGATSTDNSLTLVELLLPSSSVKAANVL